MKHQLRNQISVFNFNKFYYQIQRKITISNNVDYNIHSETDANFFLTFLHIKPDLVD